MTKIKVNQSTKLNYRTAGVDVDKANKLVKSIKDIAKETTRPEVLTGIGGFGGLFELPLGQYRKPVLVSGTDGVGTKLKLATKMRKHDSIGIDLVAMCVNDIITLGAEPLFFLDYYATGKLNPDQTTQVLKGIGKGCKEANMALIGGETAEMPGMYQNNDYDLAGFCVGIVEKDQILTRENVKPGDAIIAIASSGTHSNGYSLIHKIIERSQKNLTDTFGDTTLGDTLLTPTKIYAKAFAALKQTNLPLHAAAHITGGGLIDNIPRILPPYCKAIVKQQSWEWPEIFQWLQKQGNIDFNEMYRTFNVGIGMIIITKNDAAEKIIAELTKQGEKAWVVGEIQSQNQEEGTVEIQ